MNQSKEQFEKMTQDAANMGRENVDAFVKSGTIFAKGFEMLTRTTMELAQASAEKQSQYVKEAMASKTVNEWAETQNKIAQANLDDFMSSVTKMSEMSTKVMTETAEPLNEQLGKSIQQATSNIAA